MVMRFFLKMHKKIANELSPLGQKPKECQAIDLVSFPEAPIVQEYNAQICRFTIMRRQVILHSGMDRVYRNEHNHKLVMHRKPD